MSPSRSSDAPPFSGSEFQEIGGVTLHLRRWRSESRRPAARALLLHGFGGSTFSWRRVGPGLSEMGFDTTAVDLPGFGYSSRLSTLPAASAARPWPGLMWELLDRLGVTEVQEENEQSEGAGKWVLVAHSIGGRVVSRMALERPQLVTRLVLVDAELSGPPTTFPFLRVPPVRWIIGRWLSHQVLTEQGVGRLLESAYGRHATSEEVRGYLAPFLIPGTVDDLLRLGSALPAVAASDLERIEQPTLIVWGEEDGWIGAKNALRLFNEFPVSEIYTIPGAGHLPMETHPEAVIRRLGEFLRAR